MSRELSLFEGSESHDFLAAPLGSLPRSRPSKLSATIAEEIRAQIISQRLQPGDTLPTERKMIEHFGASRATVREALKELEVQGLVRMKSGPSGGPVVTSDVALQAMQAMQNFCYFEGVTFENIFQLRVMLEMTLARSVAGRLDDETIDALARNIETSLRLSDSKDGRRLQREAEFAFHTILARKAPNRLLGLMVEIIVGMLSNATAKYSAEHALHASWSASNSDYHRRLLEALRDGDGEGAAELMREHMEDVHRHFREFHGTISLDDITLNWRSRT